MNILYEIDSFIEQDQNTGGIALAAKISEENWSGFLRSRIKVATCSSENNQGYIWPFHPGKSNFEQFKLFRHDLFFRDAFGLNYVPAAETLRLYLKRISEMHHRWIIPAATKEEQTVHTKGMTDMFPYSATLMQKAISLIQSFVKANNIAIRIHRNSLLTILK